MNYRLGFSSSTRHNALVKTVMKYIAVVVSSPHPLSRCGVWRAVFLSAVNRHYVLYGHLCGN